MEINENASPVKKRCKKETVTDHTCCFCCKVFSDDNPAISPDISKLESLFKACTIRQDDISQRLLQQKNAISSGDMKLFYHRQCRSTYTSTLHIARATANNAATPLQEANCNNENAPTRTDTASSAAIFDWNTLCFVCGGKCYSTSVILFLLLGKARSILAQPICKY